MPQRRPRPVPPPVYEDPPPLLAAQADAMTRIADALEAAIVRFGPAADAVAGLGEAQSKFCDFIVKHRVKILLAVPAALMAVGAVSPNAAKAIADLLRNYTLGI